MVLVEEVLRGEFSLLILCRTDSSQRPWVFSSVYGPVDSQRKAKFWVELDEVNKKWPLPWFIGGDFNAPRSRSERNRGYDKRTERIWNSRGQGIILLSLINSNKTGS